MSDDVMDTMPLTTTSKILDAVELAVWGRTHNTWEAKQLRQLIKAINDVVVGDPVLAELEKLRKFQRDFVSIMMGNCDKHTDISYPDFVARGGNECPLCQHAEIERLQDRNARLKSTLEGAQVAIDLQKKVAIVREENVQLRERIEAFEKGHANWHDEVDTENAALEAEVARLRAAVDELCGTLRGAETNLAPRYPKDGMYRTALRAVLDKHEKTRGNCNG